MTPDSPDAAEEPRVRCYACAEFVHPEARKCRWCGEWYEELAVRMQLPPQLATAASVDEASASASESRREVAGQQQEISDDILRTDAIALEVGEELARLANAEVGGGELLDRLKHVRRRIAREFGVIAPGAIVRPHPKLAPQQYQIRIQGDLVAEGEVLVTHQLGIGRDLDVPNVDVEHAIDPVYGTPAVWIPEQDAHRGIEHGLKMFDAQDVVATHVAEIIKQHLSELLTREEVAELLNVARRDAPMVVQELVPNMLALGQLRQVLQNLLREQVPISNLPRVLNALADNAVYTKDPHALTEHVRAALGRTICARYQSDDGTLKAFMLSPDAERAIQNAIQLNETGQVLMLDPNTSQAIQSSLADALSRLRGQIQDPVLITPPKIRRHVKALLERNFSTITVLSYSEIVAGVQIDNLQMIDAHTIEGVAPPSDPGTPAADSDWLVSGDQEIDAVDRGTGKQDWNW